MLSIVRAAVISGCRTLYTEDLQDGRRFESLQIVNPFRAVDDDSSG
jgi:predicted nucleic acid-binding protein